MQIPGYTIERELGHGGMATVYLAVQDSLGRPVALKIMSPALAADRTFSERFLKEARTIAQLSHPHIVAVYDVGVAGHDHYLALEYVGAGDLKSHIRHGARPPAEAFKIVRDIASALGYAHSKGFVHRDVKPENVLFRDNGTAVLTDFGIARAVSSGTRMTGMGMSIGTPHYMSPEQARGKDVDGRADIYALGIVLYEMLTGKVPYDAEETLAIGIMHVSEPVPTLPQPLSGHQALLDRMLAKDPANRFNTAEALIEAIDKHDPNAKPRNSGMRAITKALSSSSTHSETAKPTTSGAGLKWAVIGGIAAVAALGTVWAIQNSGKAIQGGGGGGAVVASSPKSARPTDLEVALAKPNTNAPAAVEHQMPDPEPAAPIPKAITPVKPPPVKSGNPFDQFDVADTAITPAKTPPVKSEVPNKPDPAKVELAAWEAAQASNSASGYQKYLNKYPSGTYAALAKLRMDKVAPDPAKADLAAWTAAQEANTLVAYQKYVKTYPEGTFNILARNRISKLEGSGMSEPQAWETAERANSRIGYERFLQAHPSSAYATLAKARLSRL